MGQVMARTGNLLRNLGGREREKVEAVKGNFLGNVGT